MVYVLEAARRKGGESKAAVGFRIFIAVVLVLGVIAYAGYQGYLIWKDGNDGTHAVRLLQEVHKDYMVPDIIFCANSTNVAYTCKTVTINDTTSSACQSYFVTSLQHNPDQTSEFPWCQQFKVNGMLKFNRWTGIKQIDIEVEPPADQTLDNVQVQLYDPSVNLFDKNKTCNQLTDNMGVQEACDRNIYFIPNSTRLFTVFESTIHEVMQDDIWSFLGIYDTYSNESKISSSTEKEPWGADEKKFGLFTLKPSTYLVFIQQDQKAHTLLSGFGLLGGVYGVLAGIYIVLFGQPQLQPIGLVGQASRMLKHNHKPSPSFGSGRRVSRARITAEKGQVMRPSSLYNHRKSMAIADNEAPLILETAAGTGADMASITRLENRVCRLELLLKDYVIDTEALDDKFDMSY